MKQRSTTPALKGIVTKSSLVASAVVMAFAAPIALGQQVLADRYDEQIAALRAEVSGYQAKAADLRQQAGTLAAALEILTSEKNAIQREVDLSQAKYDKLVHEIAETEQQILALLDKVTANKTVLMITHRLRGLADFNQIVVMDNGQIIESGNHDELMAKQGRYYQFKQRL